MSIEDAVKILCEYNKWRKGKGRKYPLPGIPFNPKDIDTAIDSVTALLKKTYLSEEHFLAVAEITETHLKKIGLKGRREMPSVSKSAVKSMRKAVRWLKKGK